MSHRVQFLYFDDCPNHVLARSLLDEVIRDLVPGTPVEAVNATEPEIATAHRFPGSPTIRVDGQDVMPGFVDPGDYTPRCRVFPTAAGLRGVPPREWIEDALRG
ncbi:MAG TPA: hypothetical protein VGK18_13445 [Propionicimonas sp.]|jgi:hypothetical protein|uniref:DF family (seleno)protein n=1 Tax=Propionicimonas sp. TaxID=1955623 RepID=UPI002F3EB49C